MLGSLERYMTPTLDTALLISYRAGVDLGQTSDRLESDAFLGERKSLVLMRQQSCPAYCNLNCDKAFRLLND